MKFNKLSDGEEEVFFVMSEECGEIVRAVGKILRHGLYSCHPSLPAINNYQQFLSEVGDFMCMVEYMEKLYPGFKLSVEEYKNDKILEVRARHPSTLHHVEPL